MRKQEDGGRLDHDRSGGSGLTEGDGTAANSAWGYVWRGVLRKSQARWGEGGRLSENVPQICPVPSDGDPMVSVGVSKVCTRILVSIGYCAF